MNTLLKTQSAPRIIAGGFALSFLVFDETGSTLAAALIVAIQLVPTFLLPLIFAPWMDRVEEIFSIIIPKGIGIECNTNRGNDPLPDADILRFYRQMGGEIITLGSDAHEVKDVGCVIRERQELLKDCGFRYFTTFTGGEPAFQKL